MGNRNNDAGSVPAGDGFVHALKYYLECVRDRQTAIEAFEAAQAAYFEAVNQLPVPDVMQGPVVVVTDADPIEKVRTVLTMTTVGIDAEERIVARLSQLIDYRNRKVALAAEHDITDLGETALLSASMVQRALARLMAVIGADDAETWEQAVSRYRTVKDGWNVLGNAYSDAEADALSDVWSLYRDQMFGHPVETPQGFVEKFRLLVAEGAEAREINEDHTKALLADAERLFGESVA